MCRIDNRFADSSKGEGSRVYIPLSLSLLLLFFSLPSLCFAVYVGLFLNYFTINSNLCPSPPFFRFILSLFDVSSRVTRSMSSSAERAPAQNTTTARGKLRGRIRPTRGGKTAAAAAQFAPVREGYLNAAAGQLALGGVVDMAVAAGQPVLVGGETAGDGILPGESSTIAGPQDVCCGFSENIS